MRRAVISPKSGQAIISILIAGLAALVVVALLTLPVTRVSAEGDRQPLLQDTPGYEPPPTDSAAGTAYPAPTTGNPAQATATVAGSPVPTATQTLTPTLAPDVFKTENAEMGGARTTPALTETPAPSITPYISPTVTLTATVLAPAPLQAGGPAMNWGLFWMGFSLPVLAGCGLVLYLLDHRPDLFRRRGSAGRIQGE